MEKIEQLFKKIRSHLNSLFWKVKKYFGKKEDTDINEKALLDKFISLSGNDIDFEKLPAFLSDNFSEDEIKHIISKKISIVSADGKSMTDSAIVALTFLLASVIICVIYLLDRGGFNVGTFSILFVVSVWLYVLIFKIRMISEVVSEEISKTFMYMLIRQYRSSKNDVIDSLQKAFENYANSSSVPEKGKENKGVVQVEVDADSLVKKDYVENEIRQKARKTKKK